MNIFLYDIAWWAMAVNTTFCLKNHWKVELFHQDLKKKYKKLHFLLGHKNINGVFFLKIPNDLVFLCKLKLQYNLFLYFKNYVAIT